jgi:hypothetical protein
VERFGVGVVSAQIWRRLNVSNLYHALVHELKQMLWNRCNNSIHGDWQTPVLRYRVNDGRRSQANNQVQEVKYTEQILPKHLNQSELSTPLNAARLPLNRSIGKFHWSHRFVS